MFRAGQQIGIYILVQAIGRGGFGEVWLAERRAKFVTTKVAVKLPLDEQVDHEAIKQEATVWEQASGHPNILPIIDADEYDGQIVIVSEYAPDGSLEEWLKANGAMPVERAIETTIQILDGLEFLHSRNIIHRDLKPANILLQGNTPRLADFGISRALLTTIASQSQNISGTFAYMSPEALDGKRSIQTDVWSVGVNLYQFLTGTLPFPQKEPSVLFPAIIMREFAPLPDLIPQSLKNVIAKALAKLPESRYKTAGEMREDLRRILRGEKVPNFIQFDLPETQHSFPVKRSLPTQKSPVISNRNPNKEVETVVRPKANPTFKQNNPPQKSNLWMYATIAFVLLGAIGLGIYFMANKSKQSVPNKNEVTQVSVTPLSNTSANTETINTAVNLNSNVIEPRVNTNSNIIEPTPIPTPDIARLQTVINKHIVGEVKEWDNYNEGLQGLHEESKDSRKIMFGDLDNDGDEDVAVSFLIVNKDDGGNWHNRYLAVFRNENGKFKAITNQVIGFFNGPQGELKNIYNGKIYVEDDGIVSYTLRGNKLVKGK